MRTLSRVYGPYSLISLLSTFITINVLSLAIVVSTSAAARGSHAHPQPRVGGGGGGAGGGDEGGRAHERAGEGGWSNMNMNL